MDFNYLSPTPHTVNVERTPQGDLLVVIGDTQFIARPTNRPGELWLFPQSAVAAAPIIAQLASDGPHRWVWVNGETYRLTVPEPKKKGKRAHASGHDQLEAQMPGLIRQVLVQVGDTVERGQTLMLMEAMKMEIKIAAPHAGVVEQVLVQPGQAIERGQVLLDLREVEEA